MKKILIFIPFFFVSCKTVEYKYIPVKETHTEEIIIRDTIIDIQLQLIKDSVSIQDTISYLENKYAYSKALFSGGRLNHSLATKDVKIPTEIQYIKVTVRDSIPYPIEITKTVVEKKKDFFWWFGLAAIIFIFVISILKTLKLFK